MNCRRVDRVCHYEPYSTTNPPSSASVAANNGAAKGKSPSALFPRAGVVDVSKTSLKFELAKAFPS
jgi:hypothetical protein